jgi:hypothetical protein
MSKILETLAIILGTLVLMVASGIVTLVVAIFFFAGLGLRLHDNYEYYGKYPLLFFGPAAIGFLAPGVVVWYLHKRGTRKGRSG